MKIEQRIEEHIQQISMKALELMEFAVNGWFSMLEAYFHNIHDKIWRSWSVSSSWDGG